MPLSAGKETKTARKRRKRCEMANRAADEELAEITLEQQVLKELSSKSQKQHQQNAVDQELSKSDTEPSPAPAPAPVSVSLPPGKKSKQPMSLSIADMITALEEVSLVHMKVCLGGNYQRPPLVLFWVRATPPSLF